MNWPRRLLLILLAGTLGGLLVCRVFFLQGVFAPIRIASGSMMPTLRGVHYALACGDCQFPFTCDATSLPDTGAAVCPNCGFPGNRLSTDQLRQGQRVTIDRGSLLLRLPRRWDLVAFQDPLEPASKSVKRIVGLPGETVVVREGDLFVDGRIARKPLDVQRAMAVLVHDDRYRPGRTDNLPPRWDARQPSPAGGWQQVAGGYRFSPRIDAEELQWLDYQSWHCFASPLARSELTPILDHYGYNQNTSRELHAISDASLSCRVEWPMTGTVWLRVQGRCGSFQVELNRWRQAAILRGKGAVIGRYRCPLSGGCRLEFGICDRQVFLAVNGRLTFREPFAPAQPRHPAATSPLAIGAGPGPLAIKDLQVYRDVYYLEPHQLGQTWSMRTEAGQGEFLVLGDNVPISRDSRRWPTPGISHKSLVGMVLMPF